MRVLNRQSNPLLDKPSVSFRTLRGTILESRCDMDKKPSNTEELDIVSICEKIKPDSKHGQAIARSGKIRGNAHFLPEESVKMRKNYYTNKDKGYLI